MLSELCNLSRFLTLPNTHEDGLNYGKKKLQQLSQEEIKQKLVILNEFLHEGVYISRNKRISETK